MHARGPLRKTPATMGSGAAGPDQGWAATQYMVMGP